MLKRGNFFWEWSVIFPWPGWSHFSKNIQCQPSKALVFPPLCFIASSVTSINLKLCWSVNVIFFPVNHFKILILAHPKYLVLLYFPKQRFGNHFLSFWNTTRFNFEEYFYDLKLVWKFNIFFHLLQNKTIYWYDWWYGHFCSALETTDVISTKCLSVLHCLSHKQSHEPLSDAEEAPLFFLWCI